VSKSTVLNPLEVGKFVECDLGQFVHTHCPAPQFEVTTLLRYINHFKIKKNKYSMRHVQCINTMMQHWKMRSLSSLNHLSKISNLNLDGQSCSKNSYFYFFSGFSVIPNIHHLRLSLFYPCRMLQAYRPTNYYFKYHDTKR